MMKLENECVDCGLPCLGSSCPKRQVPHFYCDECGDEVKLYHFEELELCSYCLLNKFSVVEGSEW